MDRIWRLLAPHGWVPRMAGGAGSPRNGESEERGGSRSPGGRRGAPGVREAEVAAENGELGARILTDFIVRGWTVKINRAILAKCALFAQYFFSLSILL